MNPLWEKYVSVTPRRDEHQMAKLHIVYNQTGTELVLIVDGERLTLATKWKEYVTDCGAKQLMDAITEGMQQLKVGEAR